MNKLILLLLSVACLIQASSQSSTVYVSGPSFPVPAMNDGQSVDLNTDGAPDVSFSSSGPIGTLNVPSTGMTWPFNISATGTNEFLVSDYALLLPFGASLGSTPPAGAAWSTPGGGTLLTAHWSSSNGGIVTTGWRGTLGSLGIGYVGLKFYASDGPHFGWIRIRLPRPELGPQGLPAEISPVVVDWAYGAQPGAAIASGITGSNSQSIQFTLDFQHSNAENHPSGQEHNNGTFILTGNLLRSELTLAGEFHAADIFGPASPRSHTKPIASLGTPLITGPTRSAFFGEASLSPAQVAQLLRGELRVSGDNGATIGRIVPIRER